MTDARNSMPDSEEGVPCLRCLVPTPAAELDRLLWCPACVARNRGRATRIGWASGATLVVVLALYIGVVVQPDLTLIPAGWALTLAVAFYLGGKVARELSFGIIRLRNTPEADALPPGSKRPEGPSEPAPNRLRFR
jgi:hypothetical protein